MKTIKINGIPYSSRESGIDRLVRKYNWTINEVYMPVDRHTGHSKGYAFVRFEHIDEAEEAFDRLEGKRFDGRKLSMEWARDSGGGGGRRNQRKSRSRSRSGGRRRVSRSRSRSGGRRRRSRTRSPRRSPSVRRPSRSRSRDNRRSRSRSPVNKRRSRSDSRKRSNSRRRKVSRSRSRS